MKKQFFSKLLMAAMFITAVGSFQSCKDYDGDISDLQQNVTPLKSQVETLESALASVKIDLAAAQSRADKAVEDAEFAAKNAVDVNELSQKVSEAVEAIAELSKLKADAASLEDAINSTRELLEGKVDKATYDSKVAEIAGQINAIDQKLNQLTDGLASTATLKSEVDDAKKEAKEAIASLKSDLESQINALKIFNEDVNSKLGDIKAILNSSEDATFGNILETIATKVADAEKCTAALQAKVAEIDVNTKSISEIKTSLEGLQNDILAVKEKNDQVNSRISALNVFIEKSLTSMVLKPTLYYGGIEAVEAIHGVYQPLGFSIYYEEDHTVQNGHNTQYSNVAYDRTSGNAWDITYEYNAKDDLIYKYPTIDAYYHVNPKDADFAGVTFALNTEDRHYVNTTNTRAERNSLDFGLDLVESFKTKAEVLPNGILHTEFTNNADTWHRVEQYAHTVTVASLEANVPGEDANFTRTVTSDWAAIARVHQYNYTIADNDAYIMHYATYPEIAEPNDTHCGMMFTQQRGITEQHESYTNYNRDMVHVYRQARQAILNDYTHILPYNGWVDLDSCIEVHATHEYYDAGQPFDFPVNLNKLGFVRKYTVVNYDYPKSLNINKNGTQESMHAHLLNPTKEGEMPHILKANGITNGKGDPNKVNELARYAIGREPLVMIEILDVKDTMTWNRDHMNQDATPYNNNPSYNLVAVGFIKFKIAENSEEKVIGLEIEQQKENMYASCMGDTILTTWSEVEEQILAQVQRLGLIINKGELEKNYTLRGIETENEDVSLRDINMARGYVNAQAFVPQTNKVSIIGKRINWNETMLQNGAYENWANWVLPQLVLNTDITLANFVDADRYGRIVYTNYDTRHRETNLIGVAFTAEEMLQQLVKRDHEGQYLDSLGNKVNYLSEADFYPYVDTKVAAKLIDVGHNGWPELTIVFNVRVNLNQATMSRPTIANNGGGNWYALDNSSDVKYINANIDAFKNGADAIYSRDVRRFVANLQQSLRTTTWIPSTTGKIGAFDFAYKAITGESNAERISWQKAKLGQLHGDLYFFTTNWLGDLEEGTPYWHDKDATSTIADDRFYADKYLIKVCYTMNPLDTVVWAQEKNTRHKGKLGKYLFAYKYIENYAGPTTNAQALTNYSHYDMANGELIAWIDNYDQHQVDANQNMIIRSPEYDINGRHNENVNVHYNYNSKFAQDLLNRAGRYVDDANKNVLDGYSKSSDNPFTAKVHLNLFEECNNDCNVHKQFDTYIGTPGYRVTRNHHSIPGINLAATELRKASEWNVGSAEKFILINDYANGGILHDGTGAKYPSTTALAAGLPTSEYATFFHRPAGVPVMLNNPDFLIRFERPLNVELHTNKTNSIPGVVDAETGDCIVKVHYAGMYPKSGAYDPAKHGLFRSSPDQFPQDWRGKPVVTPTDYTGAYSAELSAWVEFYQGKMNPTGSYNKWNTGAARVWPANGIAVTPAQEVQGFKYMEVDRSSYNRLSNAKFFNWNNWFYQTNTNNIYASTWNDMNVVPQVDHMLTNYGSTTEDYGFWQDRASQVNMVITHEFGATGNVVATTFRYLNDNINRTPFDILVPVTVKYAWGDITTTGKWDTTTKSGLFNYNNMLFMRVHFDGTFNNVPKK